MKLADYQKSVMRTMNTKEEWRDEVTEYALGIVGEAAEVSEHIKKFRYQGHTIEVDEVAEELGDTLWYLTALAKRLGFELKDIMELNKAKLNKRYPDGFDEEKSINREE